MIKFTITNEIGEETIVELYGNKMLINGKESLTNLEPKQCKFTEAEKLIIKAYAMIGTKWFAKDCYGFVGAYKDKPHKNYDCWTSKNEGYDIFGFNFESLSWSDDEPYEYKGEF